MADGGNLLWLGDPQPLYGLGPVAEMLGVEFLPGVVVDPASEQITGNASAIVVTSYANHPTVRNFRNVTLFVITSYSIHYTKLYDLSTVPAFTKWHKPQVNPLPLPESVNASGR